MILTMPKCQRYLGVPFFIEQNPYSLYPYRAYIYTFVGLSNEKPSFKACKAHKLHATALAEAERTIKEASCDAGFVGGKSC